MPANARLPEPLKIGPLTLLGLRASPGLLTHRQLLFVESFWRTDEELATDVRLDIRASVRPPSDMPDWGGAMDHDPCDWMMPTSAWQAGQIYRDYVGLRPPPGRLLRSGTLDIDVRTVGGGHDSALQRVPGASVELKLAPKAPGVVRTRAPHARDALAAAQRTPAKLADMHVCFLNVDMGPQPDGMEAAALARARLFALHLGCPPTLALSNGE